MQNSRRGHENSFFSSGLIHFTEKPQKVRLVSSAPVRTCFPEKWKQPAGQHASCVLPQECHSWNVQPGIPKPCRKGFRVWWELLPLVHCGQLLELLCLLVYTLDIIIYIYIYIFYIFIYNINNTNIYLYTF